jgi:hypothetical protein
VRTATSLISFGFTIYKFFEYLREDRRCARASKDRPRGCILEVDTRRAAGGTLVGRRSELLLVSSFVSRLHASVQIKDLLATMAYMMVLAVGVFVALGVVGLDTNYSRTGERRVDLNVGIS